MVHFHQQQNQPNHWYWWQKGNGDLGEGGELSPTTGNIPTQSSALTTAGTTFSAYGINSGKALLCINQGGIQDAIALKLPVWAIMTHVALTFTNNTARFIFTAGAHVTSFDSLQTQSGTSGGWPFLHMQRESRRLLKAYILMITSADFTKRS